MEAALTHPLAGYYTRADRLLGRAGDFNTAPGLSPFFNQTVARLVAELVEAALETVLETVSAAKPCVVELGGGEGQLAQAILGLWEDERPGLRGKVGYRIVEVGTQLRERQAAAVAPYVAAGWELAWGADIQRACVECRPVVMVGNEFFDALPVNVVDVTGDTPRELWVELRQGELTESWGELSAETAAEISRLFGARDPLSLRPLTSDGVLEVRPGLEAMVKEIVAAMPTGSLVTIDYGDWLPGVRHQSYECAGCALPAPPLRRRTLRGYFRHHPTRDVLARPGRQDLTADVDFAALDMHGCRVGFETVVFTTLSAFLRAGGAEDELARLRLDGEGAPATVPAGSPKRPVGPAAAPAGSPAAPAGPPAVPRAGSPTGPAASARPTDPLECDRQATVLRHLLDEENLGGAFKVMVQVKE
jgi:SAM-dependent MidA family methyltransferase